MIDIWSTMQISHNCLTAIYFVMFASATRKADNLPKYIPSEYKFPFSVLYYILLNGPSLHCSHVSYSVKGNSGLLKYKITISLSNILCLKITIKTVLNDIQHLYINLIHYILSCNDVHVLLI